MDIPLAISSIDFPPSSRFHHDVAGPTSMDKYSAPPTNGRTYSGMAIPGVAQRPLAPPALPPPRHPHGLDEGVDLAWHYQNQQSTMLSEVLAPIRSESSLFRLSVNQFQHTRKETEDIEMDLGSDTEVDLLQTDRPYKAGFGTQPPSTNTSSTFSVSRSSLDTKQR